MAVQINDFEVIVEPAPSSGQPGQTNSGTAPQADLNVEMERFLRRQRQRQARVRDY